MEAATEAELEAKLTAAMEADDAVPPPPLNACQRHQYHQLMTQVRRLIRNSNGSRMHRSRQARFVCCGKQARLGRLRGLQQAAVRVW